jgi:hypothetical protein
MRGEAYGINEPVTNGRKHELRAGERVSLDGRVGVLRYLYGDGAAVVRFDQADATKVVPLRRLQAATDEGPASDP